MKSAELQCKELQGYVENCQQASGVFFSREGVWVMMDGSNQKRAVGWGDL